MKISSLRSAGSGALLALLTAMPQLASARAAEEESAPHLRDRGPGVATSMFGTYVREGELLVYPFFEWYADSDYEYKPSELGYGLDVDHRGRYRASEGLLFLGYGLTPDVAVELEAAMITAELEKSPSDPSALPGDTEESGLGDVEGQIRWRFLRENASRPEAFTYFETVFPLQKHRRLIGTRDWEWKLGAGVTRGYRWGTVTLRAAAEYSREERKFEAGEYAVEWLKRLSPAWRVVALIEGNQLDEVALITEVQWHFHPRAFLKASSGFGLTPNATDFAPEVGLMLSL